MLFHSGTYPERGYGTKQASPSTVSPSRIHGHADNIRQDNSTYRQAQIRPPNYIGKLMDAMRARETPNYKYYVHK